MLALRRVARQYAVIVQEKTELAEHVAPVWAGRGGLLGIVVVCRVLSPWGVFLAALPLGVWSAYRLSVSSFLPMIPCAPDVSGRSFSAWSCGSVETRRGKVGKPLQELQRSVFMLVGVARAIPFRCPTSW
jgi:hypothetical protein